MTVGRRSRPLLLGKLLVVLLGKLLGVLLIVLLGGHIPVLLVTQVPHHRHMLVYQPP